MGTDRRDRVTSADGWRKILARRSRLPWSRFPSVPGRYRPPAPPTAGRCSGGSARRTDRAPPPRGVSKCPVPDKLAVATWALSRSWHDFTLPRAGERGSTTGPPPGSICGDQLRCRLLTRCSAHCQLTDTFLGALSSSLARDTKIVQNDLGRDGRASGRVTFSGCWVTPDNRPS